MSNLLTVDHSEMNEWRKNEEIQRKLNQSPTWREVIDLIAETRAQTDTLLDLYSNEAVLQYENHDTNRDGLLQDLANKIAGAVRSRKPALVEELTATLCKDIT